MILNLAKDPIRRGAESSTSESRAVLSACVYQHLQYSISSPRSVCLKNISVRHEHVNVGAQWRADPDPLEPSLQMAPHHQQGPALERFFGFLARLPPFYFFPNLFPFTLSAEPDPGPQRFSA